MDVLFKRTDQASLLYLHLPVERQSGKLLLAPLIWCVLNSFYSCLRGLLANLAARYGLNLRRLCGEGMPQGASGAKEGSTASRAAARRLACRVLSHLGDLGTMTLLVPSTQNGGWAPKARFGEHTSTSPTWLV